jgi:hypothetical protein
LSLLLFGQLFFGACSVSRRTVPQPIKKRRSDGKLKFPAQIATGTEIGAVFNTAKICLQIVEM